MPTDFIFFLKLEICTHTAFVSTSLFAWFMLTTVLPTAAEASSYHLLKALLSMDGAHSTAVPCSALQCSATQSVCVTPCSLLMAVRSVGAGTTQLSLALA